MASSTAQCLGFCALAVAAHLCTLGADPLPRAAAAGALLLLLACGIGRRSDAAAAADAPSGNACYAITPKHQTSVKNNILSGITLSCWLRLLIRHGGDIEWLTYWPRICFLSFMSILNSTVGCVEWLLYSRAWRATPLPKAPVFILVGTPPPPPWQQFPGLFLSDSCGGQGHPRTGTTLLHNMLSRDPTFILCSTFMVGFPSTFLSLVCENDEFCIQNAAPT